jgi:L-seryl-tRNA(Ser) seleniumtransferase
VVRAVRDTIEHARANGGAAPSEGWGAAVRARVQRLAAPSLLPVINATGVVLHTNLGRAPLARGARDAMARIAAGYSNLEYDLAQGTRGSRHALCRDLLVELTGAEDAIVVNNAAGALLVALSALARNGEAVVSRGELVEIGGAFRIPDIMARSGATLVEVGTTNRTHLRDYEGAVSDRTKLLLKVHRSNFQVTGFTAEVSAQEIAGVAHAHGATSLYDLGSGLLMDLSPWGLAGEPTVAEALASGVDAVVFSGDKLPAGGDSAGDAGGDRRLPQGSSRPGGPLRQIHPSRPGGYAGIVPGTSDEPPRNSRAPHADRRRHANTSTRRGVAQRRGQRRGGRRG